MKSFPITLFFVVLLALGGCNSVIETKHPESMPLVDDTEVTEDRANRTEAGDDGASLFDLFYLGMEIDEVREILEENEVEIINEIENTGDSEAWDWGNKSIWADGIDFTFDQDYILYDLGVDNEDPTPEGIKVGDHVETMKNVYGDKYKLYTPDELMTMGFFIDDSDSTEVYEYPINDHYFQAFVTDQRIASWAVSKYKFGTNSPVTEDYSEVVRKPENPLKRQLLEELEQAMESVYSDESPELNRIIASDRARGLLRLSEYSLFELSVKELRQISKAIDELRESLDASVVYSGYSPSGLHMMAIVTPIDYESNAYKDAIHQLSGYEDEYEFLSYISDQSEMRTFEVGLDLQAEDLTDQGREITLNEIVIANPDGSNQIAFSSQDYLSETLDKFNRPKMIDNVMESGIWYAFYFDKTLIYDPQITIYLNDERIVLEKQ